jgi:PAS domain S-box-containing protein
MPAENPDRDGASPEPIEAASAAAAVSPAQRPAPFDAVRSQLASIVDGVEDAIISIDGEHRITLFNHGAEGLFGWPSAEALGQPLNMLLPAAVRERHGEAVRAFGTGPVKARRMGERSRVVGRRKDGSEFPAEASISKLELPEGVVYTVILRDVTARVEAERILREQEERLREAHARTTLAMSATGLGHWQRNLEDGELACSETLLAIFGRRIEEFDGRLETVIGWVHPHDRAPLVESLRAAAGGNVANYEHEMRIVRPDGEVRWLLCKALVRRDAADRPQSLLGVALDNTERKRLEAGLEARVAARTAELASVLDAVPDAIVDASPNRYIRSVNASAERIFGYPPDELDGHHSEVLYASDADKAIIAEAWKTWEREGPERPVRVTCRRRDGTTFPAMVVGNVVRGADGSLAGRVGVIRDVTGELERQHALEQSQKMEAVGQLTGGLAHDFNNLLTVITGNLELLDMRLEDETARDLVRRADEAARMGARLTGRLLTFSRRRRLQPSRIDLNEAVLGMMELMRRTLGETIGVGATLAPGLWPTSVDPSEIENAILNLAINARDAMPDGGRILIETANVSLTREALTRSAEAVPGDYVRLSVTDTGVGMPPQIALRAFEPFFTTKAPGKGTGLGLSTIYGFVRQSGGHATIDSEVGRGTTVHLYLPRERAASTGPSTRPAASGDDAALLGERILVVEDNPDVREATVRRLEALGYVTSIAETGAAAIAMLEGGLEVDMVLSDVVMPGGVSGYDLAAWVSAHRPALALLLTSGFAPELAAEHAVEGAEAPAPTLLRKPYTRAELARAVRETLAMRQ